MKKFELRYKILTNAHLVFTSTKGTITVSQYLSEFKAIFLDPLFDKNINYLHDLRLVDKIDGDLNAHQAFADFAVSIASTKPANVVFLIKAHAPSIKKYVEGYCLMASRSNRKYWIFTEDSIESALDKVGLNSMPTLSN